MSREYRELLEQIQNKKAEAKALLADDKIEECKAMKSEIDKIQNKADLMKELEIEEKEEGIKNMTRLNDTKKANANVALNKALLGKSLTEAENALVERVGEDGGFLVPVEQVTQIKELKRNLNPLKDRCTVIPVSSSTGTMPIEVGAEDELIDFDEMTDINTSSIKFGQVAYKTKSCGDIIPVSKELLADEKAGLTPYIGKRFSQKAVRSENKKILEIVKTATDKGISDKHDILTTALNKELDVAISDMAIVLTNQDGYDYLDKLVDANGRPLLTERMDMPGAKFYKGKEIVRVSNNMLPTEGDDTQKQLPFFVGSLSEMVTFFDREGLEVAVSEHAGFERYALYLRAIERFDVQPADKNAMVKVRISL
ncbi:phage major capsid protein [Paraclostridium bifermentans]|uniref:phage major capsid protein n=1 Tax=Paraclostridium bifermentans TaxID=1490 RepID=UPI0022E13D95|nr:phage major capsid protein [Paraclostridium bifermentans]